MKFKMAPNSVFAVLLRSPWWISLGVGLAFMAASLTLLPMAYRAVGAAGSLPFFVIGAIALRRQWALPSASRVEETVQAVRAMGWPAFSAALEEAFARGGYAVERAQGAADYAVSRRGRTWLVAARRWKVGRQGEEALQALHAAAQDRGASGGVCIALGEFSGNAQAFAKRHGVVLLQGSGLAQLLKNGDLPAT